MMMIIKIYSLYY